MESEAGGWTVRHKGVASEIEGDGEWGRGGWRVRQRGGRRGMESEAGGVESAAEGGGE